MIRLIKPYISYEDVEREFKEIFDSGILTKGDYSRAFPEELKKYTGAKHAFLTTSATTALSMCLKLLDIGHGDEVVVSDFSFPASANVIEDVGATPIFADVSLDTFNMLPEELERKISDKTKAVIFVDAFGNPSGLLKIKEICQKNNILLIEDAACAIGSSINGMKVGNISDLTCFSFHPRKLLTTGEGGAILTNNDSYADKLSIKLNHGARGFDFIDYGYNYRLSELQCLMGVVQLRKLDQIVCQRNETKDLYCSLLESLGFCAQIVFDNVTHNIQSIVLKLPVGIRQSDLIAALKSENVESTIGTYSLSQCSYYKSKYNDVPKNSKFLQENTITLPCFNGVSTEFVCKTIEKIFGEGIS